MHYPWWYVPFLTSPMLIAAIATIHIFVAMYAVGGGMFLAVEAHYAHRNQDRPYLAYLRDHAWFFILLTVVFGAITGVGIWWTIGLASPLATEALIHIFVFGWAMEYVFFVIEIASAFLFYYFWDRLPPKTHTIFGYIYAVSAWISLDRARQLFRDSGRDPGASRLEPDRSLGMAGTVAERRDRPLGE